MLSFKRLTVPLACLLVAALSLAGCSLWQNKPPEQQPVQPQQPATISVPVYYLKITDKDAYLVREIHQVAPTPDPATAALNELIQGTPTTPEAKKVLPPATKILGVKIDQGLATVNFSADVLKANVGSTGEELGITSIVNTLTELPDVTKVSFQVEGKVEGPAKDWWGHVGLYDQPFKRNLAEVREPAIWIASPVPNQIIAFPVEVTGSAQAFEGRIGIRLRDAAGQVLVNNFTNTTQGMGRGDYQYQLTYTPAGPGKGQIEVYSNSPKDGSEQNKAVVPVEWK